MESLLDRGEKLDDLVAKSEHLGTQSKAFYKTVSKKQSCQHWAVRSLIALPRLHVQPTGTETELLLRSHVMPLPRPHGHASLCLFALPTTPIMPPHWISGQKVVSGSGRDSLQEGVEGDIEEWPLQKAVDLVGGGVKDAMGLFRGKSDICIIFKLYKCKHLCGVGTPAQDIWHCVLVMSTWSWQLRII